MVFSVLVADDNDVFRVRVVNKLRSVGKHGEINGVDTAERMFEFLEHNHVDLLVLEMLLPDMDGLEVLERLKGKYRGMKIIALTHFKSDDFITRIIDLGVDYAMLKPVNENVLEMRISDMEAERNDSGIGYAKGTTRQTRSSRSLDERLSNIFISVGIPAHIKGYQFLRDAIKMTVDEPNMINSITKMLYPAVAKLYETSPSKVERAIRHAIEVAWSRGKIENINSVFGIKVYNANEKPTNGEFIALVADKMLIEGAAAK